MIFCAFLVIPLSAGVVLLTQIGRSSKQVTAQTTSAINRCDFNRDGKVDKTDLEIAASGFGRVGTASKNKLYDVNGDNWVNSIDLGIIANNNPKYCLVSPIEGSPPPSLFWKLETPVVDRSNSGSDVFFTFSPVSGGNIKLIVTSLGLDSAKVAYDSGLIQAGFSQVVWRGAPGGAYVGVLTLADKDVSNKVDFKVADNLTYNRCDFNRDGKVDSEDVNLAAAGYGPVTSHNLVYDVNGDKNVNSIDLGIISAISPKYCI